MASPVHQPPRAAQVAVEQGFLDRSFLGLEEAGEQGGGDFGVVGEFRLGQELFVQADGLAVLAVVGFAGELDEAAALVFFPVAGLAVAEVGAVVVEVEGVAAGRGVVARLAFVHGDEAFGFGADGGERHEHHGLVLEGGFHQAVEHVGEVLFDVGAGGVGEHVADFFHRDLRDGGGQGGALRQAQGGEGARPGDAVGQQLAAFLEGEQRRLGGRAEIAVDLSGGKTELGEAGLQLGDIVAGLAVM